MGTMSKLLLTPFSEIRLRSRCISAVRQKRKTENGHGAFAAIKF